MIQAQLREASLWARLKAATPKLWPVPYSGKIWLDIIYLILIGALQLAILPSFLPGQMTIDLLTPWLVISFIQGRLGPNLGKAIIAAFMIETYSAVPSGFYICSYFVICVSLYLIRNSLSWRLSLPWFASFAISQLALIGFEAFVIYLAGLSDVLSPVYGLVQAARLVLATAFGMYLVDTRRIAMADEEDA